MKDKQTNDKMGKGWNIGGDEIAGGWGTFTLTFNRDVFDRHLYKCFKHGWRDAVLYVTLYLQKGGSLEGLAEWFNGELGRWLVMGDGYPPSVDGGKAETAFLDNVWVEEETNEIDGECPF